MNRKYAIERDENGKPLRMLWLGDSEPKKRAFEIRTHPMYPNVLEAYCECGGRLDWVGRHIGRRYSRFAHKCRRCRELFLLDRMYPTNENASQGAQEDV